MKKRIKIQGFLIVLAVIFLVVFARYLLPDSPDRATRLVPDAAGISLFLLGYCLRIMARGYKAELNPDGRTLVTQGPYALTRNPMYLGTLMIGLGFILLILKWWAGLIFLLAYLIIYLPEIKKEETKLQVFFGAKFKDYCKATPRFFPSVYNILRPDRQGELRFKPAWLKKEIPSLLPMSVFIGVVKLWEIRCL